MMLDKKTKLKRLQVKLKNLKAEDIMIKDVITVGESERLSDVAKRMVSKKVNGMPVVDRDGAVVGMITMSDLLLFMDMIQSGDFPENGSGDFNPTVKLAMSRIVMKVKRSTPALDIVALVKFKNVGTFPVMQGKNMVGVINRRDVCNVFYDIAKEI